jgi:glucosamine 6-phosphate synthetase-like amidotransferase/phosphosugar isomerase protein
LRERQFELPEDFMCGIFGIVTKDEQPLGHILIDAAKRRTYRGYDSVGAATLSGSQIDLRKASSSASSMLTISSWALQVVI